MSIFVTDINIVRKTRLIRFLLTSSVIHKSMHKISFLGHAKGTSRAILAFYLNVLTQRNSEAEFHQENVSCTRKTAS